MTRTNYFDENEYNAFLLNESRISTDDREPDEFSPEAVFRIDTDNES